METMSKYGSKINRPLSEIVGLSTDTKPTDKTEGIQIQNGSVFIEMDTGKKYMFDAENSQWKLIGSGGGGGGGSATLIEKSITENGTYNASDDSADGYSKVTVDVPRDVSDLTDLIERDITSIDIPDTVTSIGNAAFYYCSNLRTITIPDSVTSIGNQAFYECSNLRTITIPDSVTSIGGYAFGRCRDLTTITIPSSVESIGNYAFSSTGLATITINKAEGSISGAPWGATNATVVWTG